MRHNVDAEHPGSLDIGYAVLVLVLIVLGAGRGKHHLRWRVGDSVEEGIGARLLIPSASRVDIQPIRRGAMIALKGLWGRPWPSSGR